MSTLKNPTQPLSFVVTPGYHEITADSNANNRNKRNKLPAFVPSTN